MTLTDDWGVGVESPFLLTDWYAWTSLSLGGLHVVYVEHLVLRTLAVDGDSPLEDGLAVGKVGYLTVMSTRVGDVGTATSVDGQRPSAIGRLDGSELEVVATDYLILTDLRIARVEVADDNIVVERAGDGTDDVGTVSEAIPCLELDWHDVPLVDPPTVGVVALADLDVGGRVVEVALHGLSPLVGAVIVPYARWVVGWDVGVDHSLLRSGSLFLLGLVDEPAVVYE